MDTIKHGDLRVWWIPQVPMTPFHVPVSTPHEGFKWMYYLAEYDTFQYKHKVKPDYSNTGGLEAWNADDQEWQTWYNEETGEDDREAYATWCDVYENGTDDEYDDGDDDDDDDEYDD